MKLLLHTISSLHKCNVTFFFIRCFLRSGPLGLKFMRHSFTLPTWCSLSASDLMMLNSAPSDAMILTTRSVVTSDVNNFQLNSCFAWPRMSVQYLWSRWWAGFIRSMLMGDHSWLGKTNFTWKYVVQGTTCRMGPLTPNENFTFSARRCIIIKHEFCHAWSPYIHVHTLVWLARPFYPFPGY